jgi:2-polyprenyl-3-methyl-5-hydroxy-6-metoxy-1,4-benzoquinol methylase
MDVADAFGTELSLEDENKITAIINNDEWPQAVDPQLIVSTLADKMTRAESVLYLFLQDQVAGKKILDFGTGEGHMAVAVANKGANLAVGYDINQYDSWATFPQGSNLIFSTDFNLVSQHGPYDSVILYDVLDHTKNPVGVLQQVRGVLSDTGKVAIRCHPWCSRHGGHLYRSMNKAYAHLFLSTEVVFRLSGGMAPLQRVIHPIQTYRNWFRDAGFKVDSEEIVREGPEQFFMKEPQSKVIKAWFRTSFDPNLANGTYFPLYQVSQQFNDYVISKA